MPGVTRTGDATTTGHGCDTTTTVIGPSTDVFCNSLGVDAILETQVHKGENMKGKFGRILGNFMTMNGEHCADVLMREGHAVAYSGGSKDANIHRHLENRQALIDSGAVIVPEGMTMTKPTLGKLPEEVVENDPPIVKTATTKKTTKKTTTKKK